MSLNKIWWVRNQGVFEKEELVSSSGWAKNSLFILIKVYPTLTIKHQVLGSTLTGRNILIGFDIFHQITSLWWSSKGLSHKQHLLTWTQVSHLFVVDPYDCLRFQIINDCLRGATHKIRQCIYKLHLFIFIFIFLWSLDKIKKQRETLGTVKLITSIFHTIYKIWISNAYNFNNQW